MPLNELHNSRYIKILDNDCLEQNYIGNFAFMIM